MKIVYKIKGLKEYANFSFINSEICFFDINNQLNIIDINTFEIQHIISMKEDFYFVSDNTYIYIYMEEAGIYFIENGILKKYWESGYSKSTIFNDHYLIGSQYNKDIDVFQVAFYEKNSKMKIWQQNFPYESSIIKTYDHLFLADAYLNPTFLENINLKTGKKEWIINFSQKKHGNILKYNNTLIIPLNNDHLLGIDAQTGKRLWELEDCFNYYNLEEATGLLYGYARDFFEVVDVAKGEKILEKRFIGSMEKYQISPDQNMNVLASNSLYFVSNWKGSTKFGKINIHRQEIEFVQELGIEEGVKAKKPVFHNGRLYILDSVGTLHIFEEE